MKVQTFSNPTPAVSRRPATTSVETAGPADLAEIGSSPREMGLGKDLNGFIWGAVGSAAGSVAGATFGAVHYGSVLAGVGGGVAGLAIGGTLGYVIGRASYNSAGDWI